MRITKLELQKHKTGLPSGKKIDRYSIFIDEEFVVGVDEQIVIKFCLREGKEITQEELKDIIDSEEKHKVKQKALILLSYRARSKKEMTEKLKEKEYKPEYINETVAEFEKVGLLNDLEYAKLWIGTYKNSYGSFKLKFLLKTKGISAEIIKQAFDESEISDLDTAKHIAEKWRRSHNHLPKEEANHKLMGFLARRGIGYETIQKIIDN